MPNSLDTKAPPGPLEAVVVPRLWIVGRFRGADANGNPAWDLQGVFDSEEKAEAVCKGHEWFVGPVRMNEPLPEDATPWPGCRYPKSE